MTRGAPLSDSTFTDYYLEYTQLQEYDCMNV